MPPDEFAELFEVPEMSASSPIEWKVASVVDEFDAPVAPAAA